jgi:hypothetical protein
MSLHSSMSLEAIFNRIARDQTTGAPIDADAKQRNVDFVALAHENVKAWKLAQEIATQTDRIVHGFNQIADMSPELEAALNAMIETQQKGG